MNNSVTVALAQLDLVVGDVKGNTERILETAVRARDELQADLVVFPELSICGYPPEDLLFHVGLRHAVERSRCLSGSPSTRVRRSSIAAP
jgi:NAD+ synthase (glutamine-hydrolysing)